MTTARRGFAILFKILYLGPFFLFAGWMLVHLYAPSGYAEEIDEPEEDEVIYIEELEEPEPVRTHFHMDADFEQPEPFAKQCLECHGTYSHQLDETRRAMLNLHGFMSCTTCHVREVPKGELSHSWVDRETSEITGGPTGEMGKYSAKLFTVVSMEGAPPKVVQIIAPDEAEQFLEKGAKSAQYRRQPILRLHNGMAEVPVDCEDCHKKDSYLDLPSIGFDEERIEALTTCSLPNKRCFTDWPPARDGEPAPTPPVVDEEATPEEPE